MCWSKFGLSLGMSDPRYWSLSLDIQRIARETRGNCFIDADSSKNKDQARA